METKELERCLHLIDYWSNGDETVINKMLNNEIDIVKDFVEPFRRELDNNLLSKDTNEAKKDLIKYVVFEFYELQGFYKAYNEILFYGSYGNYSAVFYEHTNEAGTKRKLNEFENYVVNSYILFDMLFNEIQLCCIKYEIDFFKVCNELDFSTGYFDSGITQGFKEKRKANLPPQQPETKTEQETIEMKPVLKPEAVQIVFDIIKDFFSPEQQTELKQVIETGNKASKKMLFKGNGNRLTDTFKKLIEHDFIICCQKQDLINWIISNFTFTQQNKVKAFIYDTVEKTISRKDNPCKSPLIKIENGQIQKVEQPRTKKYNKY